MGSPASSSSFARQATRTGRVRAALEGIGTAQLVLLAAVVAVAYALRIWGAWFGLPHVYHADEGFEVYRAVRLGMGGFDFERVAKGGYYLLLFAEYGVYFVTLLATGAISGVSDFALRFVEDPSAFWKIGRATTAVLGTATAGLVWFQGRRMAGARAGLLGAAFLALSAQHVYNSHYVAVDVPMALWTFLALILIAEDSTGRTRMRRWVFALVAAYAVMNKQPAALLFLPFFLARWMEGRLRGPGGLLTRSTWVPVVGAVVVYCVANPGIMVDFSTQVSESFGAVTGAPDPAGEYTEPTSVNLWIYYARVLRDSQGPGMLVLALLGTAFGLWRRDRGVLVHLTFLGALFALIAGASTSHLFYPRYVVPLLPGLCLLAGLGLDEIIRRLRLPPRAGGALAAAVALLVVAEPGRAIVRWDQRMTRTDTRTLAAEWIETHLPHRTRILLEGFPEDTAQLSIPLRNTKKNVREMIERLRSTDPGKARFWEMKVETQEKPMYDLVTVRHYEPWGTLSGYLAQDVSHAVLRREFFLPRTGLSERLPSEAQATRAAFYEELLSYPEAERLATFEADREGRPGHDIEIWRIGPGADIGTDEDDE